MKAYCVDKECEVLAEQAENRRLVKPWVDMLLSKAASCDGPGFRGQVELLVGWGLRDRERRPVVKQVVHIVGERVP